MIKRFPYRHAHKSIWSRKFLSGDFSDDSRLGQVDKAKIKVIEINLINNYECLIVEFTGADQERWGISGNTKFHLQWQCHPLHKRTLTDDGVCT